jgi:tryptophan-rich sensory protein
MLPRDYHPISAHETAGTLTSLKACTSTQSPLFSPASRKPFASFRMMFFAIAEVINLVVSLASIYIYSKKKKKKKSVSPCSMYREVENQIFAHFFITIVRLVIKHPREQICCRQRTSLRPCEEWGSGFRHC